MVTLALMSGTIMTAWTTHTRRTITQKVATTGGFVFTSDKNKLLILKFRLAARNGRQAHPSVYQFFGVLNKELANVKTKISQLEAGQNLRGQSARAKVLMGSRLRLRDLLQQRQITLARYMRSQGHSTVKQKYRKPANTGQVDEAVRGALRSVTDADDDVQVQPGLNPRMFAAGGGGRGRRGQARGVRGRGAAPAYRECEGCGGNYRSNYIRRHQRDHCGGRQADDEEEANEDGEEVSDEDDVEGCHVDELLAVANDIDETILGARRRTGNWRREDEIEGEQALDLQRHLESERQRQQMQEGRREERGFLTYSDADALTPPRQRRRMEDQDLLLPQNPLDDLSLGTLGGSDDEDTQRLQDRFDALRGRGYQAVPLPQSLPQSSDIGFNFLLPTNQGE